MVTMDPLHHAHSAKRREPSQIPRDPDVYVTSLKSLEVRIIGDAIPTVPLIRTCIKRTSLGFCSLYDVVPLSMAGFTTKNDHFCVVQGRMTAILGSQSPSRDEAELLLPKDPPQDCSVGSMNNVAGEEWLIVHNMANNALMI